MAYIIPKGDIIFWIFQEMLSLMSPTTGDSRLLKLVFEKRAFEHIISPTSLVRFPLVPPEMSSVFGWMDFPLEVSSVESLGISHRHEKT